MSQVEQCTARKRLLELRVVDLKIELEKRKLELKGNKRDLADRLLKALADEGHSPDKYITDVMKIPVKQTPETLRATARLPVKRLLRKSRDNGATEVSQEEENADEDAEENMSKIEFTKKEINKDEDCQGEKNEKLSGIQGNKKHVHTTSGHLSTKPECVPILTSLHIETTVKSETYRPLQAKRGATSISSLDNNQSKITPVYQKENIKLKDASPIVKFIENFTIKRATSQEIKDKKSKETTEVIYHPKCAVEKDKQTVTMEIGVSSNDTSQSAENGRSSLTANPRSQIETKTADQQKVGGKIQQVVLSGRNLWVSGLDRTARATDLKQLFSTCGKVTGAKTVVDRLSRVYGFVTMASDHEATVCVEKLQGAELQKRRIAVRKTTREPSSSYKKPEMLREKQGESPRMLCLVDPKTTQIEDGSRANHNVKTANEGTIQGETSLKIQENVRSQELTSTPCKKDELVVTGPEVVDKEKLQLDAGDSTIQRETSLEIQENVQSPELTSTPCKKDELVDRSPEVDDKEKMMPDVAVDTGVDAVVDTAVDAAVDTAVDTAVDAAVDTAVDAPVDTAVDAAVDTAVDGGDSVQEKDIKPDVETLQTKIQEACDNMAEIVADNMPKIIKPEKIQDGEDIEKFQKSNEIAQEEMCEEVESDDSAKKKTVVDVSEEKKPVEKRELHSKEREIHSRDRSRDRKRSHRSSKSRKHIVKDSRHSTYHQPHSFGKSFGSRRNFMPYVKEDRFYSYHDRRHDSERHHQKRFENLRARDIERKNLRESYEIEREREKLRHDKEQLRAEKEKIKRETEELEFRKLSQLIIDKERAEKEKMKREIEDLVKLTQIMDREPDDHHGLKRPYDGHGDEEYYWDERKRLIGPSDLVPEIHNRYCEFGREHGAFPERRSERFDGRLNDDIPEFEPSGREGHQDPEERAFSRGSRRNDSPERKPRERLFERPHSHRNSYPNDRGHPFDRWQIVQNERPSKFGPTHVPPGGSQWAPVRKGGNWEGPHPPIPGHPPERWMGIEHIHGQPPMGMNLQPNMCPPGQVHPMYDNSGTELVGGNMPGNFSANRFNLRRF